MKVRSKRSIPLTPRHHHRQIYKKQSSTNRHRWGAIAPALLRLKRNSHINIDQHFARNVGDIMHRNQANGHIDPHEAAYIKYYEKIRQKHRNYISNLLRIHHANDSSSPTVRTDSSISRLLHNTGNDNEFNRNGDTHRLLEDKSAAETVFHELNALAILPIPLPNINANMKKVVHSQPFINNTYIGRSWNHDKNIAPLYDRAHHFGRRIPEQKNSTAVSNFSLP